MEQYNHIPEINNTNNLELNDFETSQNHPINTSQNVNYNTNGETGFHQDSLINQETEFGMDNGFNVTNTVPKFHNENQMEWWMLTWKNFEQIKSITAGDI